MGSWIQPKCKVLAPALEDSAARDGLRVAEGSNNRAVSEAKADRKVADNKGLPRGVDNSNLRKAVRRVGHNLALSNNEGKAVYPKPQRHAIFVNRAKLTSLFLANP